MAARTFVIGDLHGDYDALGRLCARLPAMHPEDTVVFLGDYLDRGPRSREVVRVVRAIDRDLGCKVVALRGNHEDGWLRALQDGWPEFVLPPPNGCLATLRSYVGGPPPAEGELPGTSELASLLRGTFFPDDVVAWLRELAWWYEDEHAIYVHAGLPQGGGRWLHPAQVLTKSVLLWARTDAFFREYRGKRVVVGHTCTAQLPQELSSITPADPTDVFAGECVLAIDTGAGKSGFLTCVELPALTIYESR